jgi:ATP-dependent Clp protease adaptor protein ClpS
MAVTVRTNILPQIDKPKMYLVFIIYEKHISWEFSMKVLMNVFHKNIEQAEFITEAILSQGEGLCGAYMLEIAETKAELVEEYAKKEGYSMRCLVEEV